MKLLREIGRGLKYFWLFICRNKLHIIPVFLWLVTFSVALNNNIIWSQTLGPLVACLFYYLLILFPGFYAAWKKKYPSSSSDKRQP